MPPRGLRAAAEGHLERRPADAAAGSPALPGRARSRRVTGAAFGQRRKMLRQSLKSLTPGCRRPPRRGRHPRDRARRGGAGRRLCRGWRMRSTSPERAMAITLLRLSGLAMADSLSWRAGKARAGVPAAEAARGVRQAARPSEMKRGERGARLLPRGPAASRERQEGKGRNRRPAGPTHPARDAFGPWPRASAPAAPLRAKAALSASARTRVFHRDGRGRRQDAGRRALSRRRPEAENPETPPCEDGLSAASAAAGEPPPKPPPRAPGRALASPPDHPSAMPPHVTTPHERAPLPGGMGHVRTKCEGCQGLFSPLPNGRGIVILMLCANPDHGFRWFSAARRQCAPKKIRSNSSL